MDLSSIAGWPGVIVAIIFLLIGLIRKQTILLVMGTVFSFPFMLYLYGTPRFGMEIFILTASLVGAMIAIRKGYIWLSWLLFLPFILFVLWLMKELFF